MTTTPPAFCFGLAQALGLALAIVPLCGAAAGSPASGPATQPVDRFNYVIGTQTFHPTYQFTADPPLLETARAIQAMGSNVIKFGILRNYSAGHEAPGKRGNVLAANPAIHNLTELVRDEPTHRQVLDMPFAYFVLWAHTFANDADWREHFTAADAQAEYREMYDLVRYLLTRYDGTGKTFYLGHWEGDGWLRHSTRPENDALVTPDRVGRMVDWLNTRQRAVDDARRDTPHHDVQVWHYTEVNHVRIAMEQGRPALVNKVLPRTHVDFVSYSSYDTASDPELLKKALTYIESQLPPKAGFTTKRVFIGEFGFPAVRYAPEEQDQKSRTVLRAALEWNCPFALYWEIYNNEIDQRGQVGFWMIDDKGNQRPIYQTYKMFYERARGYVAGFERDHGRAPTPAEYAGAAVKFLDR